MRIIKRLFWLLLIVTVIMITAPGQLAGQGDKVELVLRILPGHYYREIVPEEETTLYMEIRNAGDQVITDIRLIADNPEGWTISIKPDHISYLSPGSSKTIDVSVMAPPETKRGDYTLSLIAEASQTRTVTTTVLQVEKGYSLWLWIGGGLAALVIAAFVMIYLRFGRE